MAVRRRRPFDGRPYDHAVSLDPFGTLLVVVLGSATLLGLLGLVGLYLTRKGR